MKNKHIIALFLVSNSYFFSIYANIKPESIATNFSRDITGKNALYNYYFFSTGFFADYTLKKVKITTGLLYHQYNAKRKDTTDYGPWLTGPAPFAKVRLNYKYIGLEIPIFINSNIFTINKLTLKAKFGFSNVFTIQSRSINRTYDYPSGVTHIVTAKEPPRIYINQFNLLPELSYDFNKPYSIALFFYYKLNLFIIGGSKFNAYPDVRCGLGLNIKYRLHKE